jgi:transposase
MMTIPRLDYKEFARPKPACSFDFPVPLSARKRKDKPAMQNRRNVMDAPAALVGIDWADEQHAVCLRPTGRSRCEASTLKQTPEAIDEWASGLRRRFEGRPVAVSLEQSKGALIYALMKYDFFILYPINPAQLAHYRKAMSQSGAKDDPSDAYLLLEYLSHYRDRMHAWKPDDQATRLIRILVEKRRTTIALRTRLSNRLRAELKCYFPQALELIGEDLGTRMACDFLSQWPTLAALKRAPIKTIREFYHAHNCRGRKRIEARLEKIRHARPLTTDQALIEAGVMEVRTLVPVLRELIEPIAACEKRLDELMDAHPDARIFTSLPGAGRALAPRLLAAFGTDRDAIDSAQTMQTCSGIAPVTKRSGKSCFVHRRWACPKFVRQTFHEFAQHSMGSSQWAKAYYQLQTQRGNKHHAAIRALAFKWIRIILRCWKTRTPYNEERYIQALFEKQSPLVHFL